MEDVHKQLPDFIFVRQFDIEQEAGLALAGTMVTDIPRSVEPSRDDTELIVEIIEKLVAAVRQDPDGVGQVGIWCGAGRDKEPDDCLPPFPVEAVESKAERSIVIVIRIDRNSPDFRTGLRRHLKDVLARRSK